MNISVPLKKGRKFDQVIAGAREVFLREGFEGASVDQIARDAGVSKATLYSYFPDKQALFMAVLTSQCQMQSEQAMGIEILQRPVPEALYSIARSFLNFLMSDFSIQVFRVCVAESNRFPELGRAFYDSGPKQALDQIAAYLGSEKVARELKIDDPYMAADQFLQLCRADMLLRRILNVDTDDSPDKMDRIARETVATFLARYRRA
ncbi:TetR/AcrR family transcriptional regulator [Nioella sediminis]|jgi:AcrR family transcriptional regulator|uniref:TetR/AcrR family transcriptional regulator n=1 Tax=Nioella sediminis TaxID=1912092 RepID=UPI0008FD67E8|nr:TetR/AcrR family transcriptional regulator [Nioella sediminis]TBX15996.1 TetR family transcriptional regulator [Roseovarius sp. JS7-11]